MQNVFYYVIWQDKRYKLKDFFWIDIFLLENGPRTLRRHSYTLSATIVAQSGKIDTDPVSSSHNPVLCILLSRASPRVLLPIRRKICSQPQPQLAHIKHKYIYIIVLSSISCFCDCWWPCWNGDPTKRIDKITKWAMPHNLKSFASSVHYSCVVGVHILSKYSSMDCRYKRKQKFMVENARSHGHEKSSNEAPSRIRRVKARTTHVSTGLRPRFPYTLMFDPTSFGLNLLWRSSKAFRYIL